MIRQQNGRYGFALVPAPAPSVHAYLRAVVPWPDGSAVPRYALIAASGKRGFVYPASLQRSVPMPGLWSDPARAGFGFELRRVGGDWRVTVYSFDEEGRPTWYRGDGSMRAGRWRADAQGLLRYRMAGDGGRKVDAGTGAIEVDPRTAQSLEITFDPQAVEDACRSWQRARIGSLAMATLTLGDASTVFCIEPLALAEGGRPTVDIDGIWSARDSAVAWQLAIANQGEDPDARVTALVTYFDRRGAPRWALAAGNWRRGAADLELLAMRGACPLCPPRAPQPKSVGALTLRASGECGSTHVVASLRIADAIFAPTAGIELAPTALLGCY